MRISLYICYIYVYSGGAYELWTAAPHDAGKAEEFETEQ